MIKIVEKKKIWFSISLTVILLGLVLLFTRGLNFGIDFKGGTKLQIELGEKLDTAALDEIIKKYDSSASCKIVNNTPVSYTHLNLLLLNLYFYGYLMLFLIRQTLVLLGFL